MAEKQEGSGVEAWQKINHHTKIVLTEIDYILKDSIELSSIQKQEKQRQKSPALAAVAPQAQAQSIPDDQPEAQSIPDDNPTTTATTPAINPRLQPDDNPCKQRQQHQQGDMANSFLKLPTTGEKKTTSIGSSSSKTTAHETLAELTVSAEVSEQPATGPAAAVVAENDDVDDNEERYIPSRMMKMKEDQAVEESETTISGKDYAALAGDPIAYTNRLFFGSTVEVMLAGPESTPADKGEWSPAHQKQPCVYRIKAEAENNQLDGAADKPGWSLTDQDDTCRARIVADANQNQLGTRADKATTDQERVCSARIAIGTVQNQIGSPANKKEWSLTDQNESHSAKIAANANQNPLGALANKLEWSPIDQEKSRGATIIAEAKKNPVGAAVDKAELFQAEQSEYLGARIVTEAGQNQFGTPAYKTEWSLTDQDDSCGGRIVAGAERNQLGTPAYKKKWSQIGQHEPFGAKIIAKAKQNQRGTPSEKTEWSQAEQKIVAKAKENQFGTPAYKTEWSLTDQDDSCGAKIVVGAERNQLSTPANKEEWSPIDQNEPFGAKIIAETERNPLGDPSEKTEWSRPDQNEPIGSRMIEEAERNPLGASVDKANWYRVNQDESCGAWIVTQAGKNQFGTPAYKTEWSLTDQDDSCGVRLVTGAEQNQPGTPAYKKEWSLTDQNESYGAKIIAESEQYQLDATQQPVRSTIQADSELSSNRGLAVGELENGSEQAASKLNDNSGVDGIDVGNKGQCSSPDDRNQPSRAGMIMTEAEKLVSSVDYAVNTLQPASRNDEVPQGDWKSNGSPGQKVEELAAYSSELKGYSGHFVKTELNRESEVNGLAESEKYQLNAAQQSANPTPEVLQGDLEANDTAAGQRVEELNNSPGQTVGEPIEYSWQAVGESSGNPGLGGTVVVENKETVEGKNLGQMRNWSSTDVIMMGALTRSESVMDRRLRLIDGSDFLNGGQRQDSADGYFTLEAIRGPNTIFTMAGRRHPPSKITNKNKTKMGQQIDVFVVGDDQETSDVSVVADDRIAVETTNGGGLQTPQLYPIPAGGNVGRTMRHAQRESFNRLSETTSRMIMNARAARARNASPKADDVPPAVPPIKNQTNRFQSPPSASLPHEIDFTIGIGGGGGGGEGVDLDEKARKKMKSISFPLPSTINPPTATSVHQQRPSNINNDDKGNGTIPEAGNDKKMKLFESQAETSPENDRFPSSTLTKPAIKTGDEAPPQIPSPKNAHQQGQQRVGHQKEIDIRPIDANDAAPNDTAAYDVTAANGEVEVEFEEVGAVDDVTAVSSKSNTSRPSVPVDRVKKAAAASAAVSVAIMSEYALNALNSEFLISSTGSEEGGGNDQGHRRSTGIENNSCNNPKDEEESLPKTIYVRKRE